MIFLLFRLTAEVRSNLLGGCLAKIGKVNFRLEQVILLMVLDSSNPKTALDAIKCDETHGFIVGAGMVNSPDFESFFDFHYDSILRNFLLNCKKKLFTIYFGISESISKS